MSNRILVLPLDGSPAYHIEETLTEGSASSGNFAPDHVGRPGEVGGSGNSGGNDLGLSKSAFDTKNKFGSDTGGVNDEWFSENKNTITAWYDNLRIQLPTKYLATLDGVAHASISASNPHVLDYTEKMKAAGSYDAFLKDYHGVNHDITLQVNADGKQQIYEGNARAQAAHNAGYANIPVRIIFVGGGERFWRPTDIPKSLREGSASSGNFSPDHVGRPGLVGGSGNANGASSQPGEHVLKVSNAPGEHTLVINSVTNGVLVYNGSSKEPDIQNTALSEIDKNINEIPAQVRQLNEVFFTDDMHLLSMVSGPMNMPHTTGVTLTNSPTVGFNTALIASRVFDKSAELYSVADIATSREQYTRLIVDHEMGHVLYNTLGNNVKADWHELVGYFTKDTIQSMSKYSATQPMEAFAEAYSLYVNNMSLAVSFKEFMRDNAKIGDHHLHESDVSIDQPIAFFCGFGDAPTYHVYKDRVEKFPLTIRLTEGSASSGNFAPEHVGRPGFVGGSGGVGGSPISQDWPMLGSYRSFKKSDAYPSVDDVRSVSQFTDIKFDATSFHGSTQPNEVINNGFDARKTTATMFGPGVYFTSDKSVAQGHARDGAVLAVHITANLASMTKDGWDKLNDNFIARSGSSSARQGGLIMNYLMDKGYDGLQIRGMSDGSDWIILGKPSTTIQSVKLKESITLTEGGSGSGNFDHAGRPGLRGGSAQGRDPVPIALRGLAASGGFSVSIHGVVPHQGYMIAGDISEETHPIVGGTQAGVRKAIVEFAGSHGRLLNKSERYIGGWVEKNQVVLDVSKRFAVGRSEALQIARSKDQIAVYKLGNPGKTIYTMSDKLRPSESKGKILESDRPDDGIAFIIAPGQNIEEAARKIAEAWGAKFNRK